MDDNPVIATAERLLGRQISPAEVKQGEERHEFSGRRNVGKAAIRAAFTPQFAGAFGTMRFLDEDLFADAASGKVMASWRCTLVVKGKPTAWRGLDLLHFAGGKLVQKLTYAKAKSPLFEE